MNDEQLSTWIYSITVEPIQMLNGYNARIISTINIDLVVRVIHNNTSITEYYNKGLDDSAGATKILGNWKKTV